MNDDIHSLSGAYAIDAVDELERARFEQHLQLCPECAAEVVSLREAAELLSLLAVATPPRRLREQVLRDISAVRPLAPQLRDEAGARIESTAGRRRMEGSSMGRARGAQPRFMPRLVAAAAAAVLLISGAAVWHPWDRQSQGQVTVAQRVLDAPDAERATKTFPDGASATVVRSKSVGRAVLVTQQMPGPPEGKVYEAWLRDPSGTFKPAGLMPPVSDQTVVLEGDAAAATAAGITVEPAGGSLHPTSEPIALFSFA